MTRTRIVLLSCAMFALTVGVATATAGTGSNSANAKLCQKGGWAKLIDSTGASFTGEEACVSYAAQGGVLTAKPKAQIDCESLHGTYRGETFFFFTCFTWVANDAAARSAGENLLWADCGAAFGSGFADNPDPLGQTAFPMTLTFTCEGE
jgi:hypothetical protein